MAEPVRIFGQPHERAPRLHALDLNEEILRAAVAQGVAARKACTGFHPPNAPGFVQWMETHVGLRALLKPRGWTPDDAGGFSTVVHPAGSFAITVATGDDRTGREGFPHPSTKYPRGPLTQPGSTAGRRVSP